MIERTEITNYLNNCFEQSKYNEKVDNAKVEQKVLGTLELQELDFVFGLKKLIEELSFDAEIKKAKFEGLSNLINKLIEQGADVKSSLSTLPEDTNIDDALINLSWQKSKRQDYAINNIKELLGKIKTFDGSQKKFDNYQNNLIYKDCFWLIWDYFNDYNNEQEIICLKELNEILPLMKEFVELFENNTK